MWVDNCDRAVYWMKVCLVLSDVTYPPVEGLAEQSLLLVQALVGAKVDVDVFALCKNPAAVDLDRLRSDIGIDLSGRLVPYYGTRLACGWKNRLRLLRPASPAAKLARQLTSSNYDVIHLDGTAAAGLFRFNDAHRMLVSWIDAAARRNLIFAWTFLRNGDRAFVKHLAAAVAAAALELTARSRRTTWHVVSEIDSSHLRRMYGVRCVAIPVVTPIDTRYIGEASEVPVRNRNRNPEKLRILVLADLRHHHMMVGFNLLANRVLPHVSKLSECHIVVLGRADRAALAGARLADYGDSLSILGWVPDFVAQLRMADIVLLPDFVGTGIKNRAVQSLAAGCAVLGTPCSFDGLPVVHREHALVGELQGDWPKLLDEVIADADLRQRLGGRASDAVTGLDVDSVGRHWSALYESVCANRTVPQAPSGSAKTSR